MEFKANVAVVFKGDRVRRGQVIDASPAEVAHLGADVTPVGEIVEAPKAPEAPVALEDMNYAQLQASAKELGLSAAGSAADIRERIQLHLAGNTDEQSDEDGSEDEGEATDEQSDEDGSEG